MIGSLIEGLAEEIARPITTAFIVGGGGVSLLQEMRAVRAERLVLTEPDPNLVEALRREIRARRGEEVVAAAMTCRKQPLASLRVLSNRKYSSTRVPVSLRRYLPNLRDVRTVQVPAESITEAITRLRLDGDADNLLVIAAPGEASGLLSCLHDSILQMFAWVVVRCSDVPLYDKEEGAGDIVVRMQHAGFDVARESAEAIFPERVVLFTRSQARMEVRRLAEDLARARSANSDLVAKLQLQKSILDKANSDLAEHQERIVEMRRQLEAEATFREGVTGQLEQIALAQQVGVGEVLTRLNALSLLHREHQSVQLELFATGHQAAFDALRSELNGLPGELAASVLAELHQQNETISQLATLVRTISERTSQDPTEANAAPAVCLARSLARRIDTSVANAARQIEAYIGVHRYLDSGRLPSLSTEGHAWPISPDFANLLIELIETNDYDLVVEFGSGYSTVLIAQAVVRRSKARRRQAAVEILTFEHLQLYLEKTRAQLDVAGVSGVVDLVHAPLEPYEAKDGSTYPYYSCLERVAALADRHDSPRTRALVLVDGPPGKTAKFARYPAVPVILSHFRRSKVDFLVDDYARPDEKEIVDMWKDELTRGGRGFETVVRQLEKNACLLSVSGEP